jgi:DNA topoisomerase-1
MIYYRIKDGFDKDKKPKFKILDKDDNPVKDKPVLEYIKKLVIPPAYADVSIFYEKSPKILFQGYDDKKRLQQIYSPEHKKKAARKKFCHLMEFGKVLPNIERDIEKNIKSIKITKDKIISLIIKIVMICGFRIGNLKYQKLYGSFGISNIFKSHIKMKNDPQNKSSTHMHINFIGKKGVLNECVIKNKELIVEINKLVSKKSAKEYVFTYTDGETKTTDKVITALEINKWLKSYHINTTSKMFRTFDTNVLFIEYMRDAEDPLKLSLAKKKKVVNEALKVISCQINNTPNICKKEYLHIDLLTLYLENPKKFKKYFFGCNEARKCFLNYLEDFCK